MMTTTCLYSCGYTAETEYDLYLHYTGVCDGTNAITINRKTLSEWLLFDDDKYFYVCKNNSAPAVSNEDYIDIFKNNEKISHIRRSDGQIYIYPYINDPISWYNIFKDKKVIDFIKKNSYWKISDGYVPKSIACFILDDIEEINNAYEVYCNSEFKSRYTCPFVSFLDTILVGDNKQRLFDYESKYMNTTIFLDAVNKYRETPKVLSRFYKSYDYTEACEIFEISVDNSNDIVMIKNDGFIHPSIAIKFMKWSHINFRKKKTPDIDQYNQFTQNNYLS